VTHHFERRTTVGAPLDSVWEFQSHISGLTTVTPRLLGLRVRELRDPDGEPLPTDGTLAVGAEIDLAVRPGGLLPGPGWTSRIVERSHTGDRAHFVDEMVDGSVRHWRHTHRFEATDEGTRVIDEIEFDAGLLTPVVAAGLRVAFADRHRRTRNALG
jgi:ligand-binding SRPBCC domain-containing protein